MKAQQEFNKIMEAVDLFRSGPTNLSVREKAHTPLRATTPRLKGLFRDWAGTTPEQFAQFLSIEHAKETLKQAKVSLYKKGAGAIKSSLRPSPVTITEMTPEEYKNGGESLTISYGFAESPFGPVIIALTGKGVCSMSFYDGSKEKAFHEMKKQFPNATYSALFNTVHQNVMSFFTQHWSGLTEIKLHVKGTVFQLKVWEALLNVPMGELTTYSAIAEELNHPKASRAVGSAVGDNPVAFLIPCHRVIKSTGEFGQYHWGSLRKKAMIAWEATKCMLRGKTQH